MGRCAQCAGERMRVVRGIRLRPATFAGLLFGVFMTLFEWGHVYLRHRPGDWTVRGPSIGVQALIVCWAMAAVGHSRHEQTSRLRLWGPVVAKSAIAYGALWAWAIVLMYRYQ